MAIKSKSGSKGFLYSLTRGALVEGDGRKVLTANTWHEVAARGAASVLPVGMLTGWWFKTPDAGSVAITPAAGDNVYPLTATRIAKTDLSWSAEEGTIDVTDDSSGGFSSFIPDGFTNITGTANGFLKFNETDGSLEDVTLSFLKKYFDYVTDDSAGTYSVTKSKNEQIILAFCMNADAKAAEFQNWMMLPVFFPSLGSGASLKDPQRRDLSWQKGEGPAVIYRRKAGSSDVLI